LIDLNRQEAVAVLFLSGALLLGTTVVVVDHFNADRFENFHVIPGAIDVPKAPVAAVLEAGPLSINQASVDRLQLSPILARRRRRPSSNIDRRTAPSPASTTCAGFEASALPR
jgi:hypothetical protein